MLSRENKKSAVTALLSKQSKSQQGFVLVIAVVVAALVSASALALFHRVNAEIETTSEMIARRKAFYAAEGAGAALMQKVKEYMNTNMDSINAGDDLTANTIANLATESLTLDTLIPGFKVEQLQVQAAADAFTGPVASGPFRGMNANQLAVKMDLTARSKTSNAVSRISVSSTVGTIGLFNFFVFSDGYLDAIDTAPMVVKGRVHTNGDFCGSGTLQIEKLTAAGKVFAESNNCLYNTGTGSFQVLRQGSTNDWRTVDPSHSHCDSAGCIGGIDWKDYASSTWSGNLMDVAHNVLTLRLPVGGYDQVLAGRDASGNVKSNINNLKVLVEPPWPGDSATALDQKYAMIADIRIIDGVWYKNNGTWPGQPIWSDHPGHFVQNASNSNGLVNSNVNAGQDDIYPSAKPHRYSYYEYDNIANSLDNDTNGIISYGMLYRDPNGGDAIWRPGFMIHHHGNGKEFCSFDSSGDKYDFSDYAIVDATEQDFPYNEDYDNSDPTDVDYETDFDGCYYCAGSDGNDDCGDSAGETLIGTNFGANYANATRMGFEDYRVRVNNGTTNHKLGRILPVNFDLAQFEAAMQDTSAGELGSYFNAGADFNGVVWISSTWPGIGNNRGALDGGGLPNLWPLLGQDAPTPMNDSVQPSHFTNHDNSTDHFSRNDAQRALPYMLSSDDLGYTFDLAVSVDWDICGSSPPYPCNPHPHRNYTTTNWVRLARPFVVPDANPPVRNRNSATGYTCTAGAISRGYCPATLDSRTNHQVSRPNAVRFINGRNISKTVFAKGLSLASNLPAYVLGDMNMAYQNSASATDCTDYPDSSTSSCDETKWMPLQIAADGVTFLSNSWRDDRARWGTSTPTSDGDYSHAHNRPKASDTQYWLAVVAGLVSTSPAAGSGGIHNFPRFLENWYDSPRAETKIEGALILGFQSSYARQRFSPPNEAGVYHPPTRTWGYDKHFDLLANQPPGTPTFTVNAVRTWRRDSDY